MGKKKRKRKGVFRQIKQQLYSSKVSHVRNYILECKSFSEWVKKHFPNDHRSLKDAKKHVDTFLRTEEYSLWCLEGLRIVFKDKDIGKGLKNSFEEKNFLCSCPYCGGKVELKKSAYVYGKWKYSDYVYVCSNFPKCNATVTTHSDTKIPLGRLANKELKCYRIRIHKVFDPMWEEGNMTRTEAYEWLAEKLGIPVNRCHIGFFDIETCKKVIEICSRSEPSNDDVIVERRELDLPMERLQEMLIEVGKILKNDISLARQGFEIDFLRNMYRKVVFLGSKPSTIQQYYIFELHKQIKQRFKQKTSLSNSITTVR